MKSTCSLPTLLPVTFTSKSQEVLSFLCSIPADMGLLFFPHGVFRWFWWLGSQKGTRGRKLMFVESLPGTRCTPFRELGCTPISWTLGQSWSPLLCKYFNFDSPQAKG